MAYTELIVVEDLPEARQWLIAQAQAVFPGARIAAASTVAEATQLARRQPPQLALVDLGLPDGSGIELIRAWSGGAARCDCVVTTIFDDAEHLFEALRAGAVGYLLKDEPEEELRRALAGIVDGRPPLSPSVARRLLDHFRPQPQAGGGLSPREREVLTLIAKGYSVRAAAELLGVAQHTAAGYLKIVYQKLRVNSRAEATVEAVRLGLVVPER